jgi:hypothetical protein
MAGLPDGFRLDWMTQFGLFPAHNLLTTERHTREQATLDETGRHVERTLAHDPSNLGSGGREAVRVRVSPLAPL